MVGLALAHVLKMTVECFLDKVRDEAADSLKDGDITELRFRELIIRELNDIKSMLRGIVRQDLIASISYLNDGIEIIYYYMSHRKKEEERQQLREKEKELRPVRMGPLKRVNFKTRGSEELLKVVEQHVIKSYNEDTENSKTIEKAKEHFKQASLSATRATSNQGMRDEDRILAYKIKIAAILLENFENPGIAIPLCKNSLAELNSMGLVTHACKVQFGTGIESVIKKRFHSEERESIIRSIAAVHRTVWHYVHACAVNQHGLEGLTTFDILKWPIVEVDGRKLHPIYDQEFASYNYWNFGRCSLRHKCLNSPTDIAINSHGNFIVSDTNNSRLVVWSSRGDFMYDLELVECEDEPQPIRPRGVAVDSKDRIFACDSVSSFVHVFEVDSKCTSKVFTKPDKFNRKTSTFSGIHVDSRDRVLVSDIAMRCVHIFTTEGEYLGNLGSTQFGNPTNVTGIYSSHITSTKDGTLLVTDARHGCIRVFNQKGFLKNISVEKEIFRPVGIAYDPCTREIIVSDQHTKRVFVFRESGEYVKDVNYDAVKGVAGLEVTCEGHVVLVDDKRSMVHVL